MFTVTAIIPDTPLLNVDELMSAVNDGLDDAAKIAKEILSEPLLTWNTPVEINVDTSEPFARFIGTEDVLYNWINSGTAAHMIPLSPKVDGHVVYATDSIPKTQPGVLSAGMGSRGSQFRRAKQVRNPGIRARNFDQQSYDTLVENDTLAISIQERINKALE